MKALSGEPRAMMRCLSNMAEVSELRFVSEKSGWWMQGGVEHRQTGGAKGVDEGNDVFGYAAPLNFHRQGLVHRIVGMNRAELHLVDDERRLCLSHQAFDHVGHSLGLFVQGVAGARRFDQVTIGLWRLRG